MPDALIKDVADTAFMVARYRAKESERPDALFRDPLAGKLAGEHGKNIVASMSSTSVLREWMVLIRTRIIDDFIQRALHSAHRLTHFRVITAGDGGFRAISAL
jgi:O-methyltransferase involved in polyketide biosynthesis